MVLLDSIFLSCGMTMNNPRYVELLLDKLRLHMVIHRSQSLCRTVAIATTRKVWQYSRKSNVKVMEWSRSSLDFHRIQHRRTETKDEVAKDQPLSA